MLLTTGLLLLLLGAAVWLFGDRMWLLGAGAGALLGFGLMRLLPTLADGASGTWIVIGLAVLLGVLAFMGKAFAKLIAMILGFVIGMALTLNLLDLFSVGPGSMDWLLSLVAGVVVALVFSRFLNWALIIFASLVGSMLIVRGAMAVFPELLDGMMGTLIVGALTAVGIFYHFRKEKPAEVAPG